MPRKSDNPRLVSFTRLPNGIQQAGIARIEFKQKHGVVTDLVQIPEGAWSTARWRFVCFRQGCVTRLVTARIELGGWVGAGVAMCKGYLVIPGHPVGGVRCDNRSVAL